MRTGLSLPPPFTGEGGEGAHHGKALQPAGSEAQSGSAYPHSAALHAGYIARAADARTTARGRGGMVDARDLKSRSRGGIGRRNGLKIRSPYRDIPVRVGSGAPLTGST